jgi:hypothetical protein
MLHNRKKSGSISYGTPDNTAPDDFRGIFSSVETNMLREYLVYFPTYWAENGGKRPEKRRRAIVGRTICVHCVSILAYPRGLR